MRFGRYDFASFSCFIAYAGCSVVIPVILVQIARALHFPLEEEGGKGLGGALQLGRSIPMVVSMIFCGFAAARWGKVRSLGVATIIMATGILLASLSPSYALLFAAVAVAGLGEGVVEGLATPVLQDIHPDEPGRYINFGHSFWSIGVVAATVGAGALVAFCGVSWRWILAIVGVAALVPAILFLLPYHGPQKPDRSRQLPGAVVRGQAARLLTNPHFWLFFVAMFLAGGGEFCLTFWVASFIELSFGGTAWTGGLGTASFAAGMIVGRMVSGVMVSQAKLRNLIVAAAVAGTLLSLLPPVLNSLAPLFGVLFLIGITVGPFWPSIQSYCVDRVKGDSTMIYIILSCAGVPGCGFFAWLMGALADHFGQSDGLRISFYLVPLCFALIGVLIGTDWLLLRKIGRRPKSANRERN